MHIAGNYSQRQGTKYFQPIHDWRLNFTTELVKTRFVRFRLTHLTFQITKYLFGMSYYMWRPNFCG